VADARVQGDGASFELRRALKWLSAAEVDVIVVTRGGGSVDDLWTFNDEALARAVWACPVPVVSAVGHEIDTTLCDLVADVRAPTPTAAAELVSPVLQELENQLSTLKLRLRKAVDKAVLHERSELRHLKGELGDPRRVLTSRRIALSELRERLQKLQPQAQLQARRAAITELHVALRRELERGVRERRQNLAALRVRLERQNPRIQIQRGQGALAAWSKRLDVAMRRRVARHRELQQKLYAKLEALSPLAVLSRGYALARRDDGHVVRAPTDVSAGEQFTLRLQHGELRVQATKKKE
jgi:exodeoxyribonuclease VII large subunit